MSNKVKVGIYGYYDHGNFGDDLMAVLVDLQLRAAGFDTTVFGMRPQDAADFDIRTEEDPDKLVDSNDAIVLGGGGMFIRHSHPWPTVVEAYEKLGRLLERCAVRGKPVFGVSLGSSGSSKLPRWQAPALQFARQARFFTLRNREDLCIAKAVGRTDLPYFPDILWSTPKYFPQNPGNATERRILINLPVPGRRLNSVINRLVCQRLAKIPDGKVYITNIHADGMNTPVDTPQATTYYKFSRLRTDLNFIAGSSLLITKRLHAGLTALSFGVPMLSMKGEHKARLMLESVGLAKCYLTDIRIALTLLKLRHPGRFLRELPRLSDGSRGALARDADKHVALLIRALQGVRR